MSLRLRTPALIAVFCAVLLAAPPIRAGVSEEQRADIDTALEKVREQYSRMDSLELRADFAFNEFRPRFDSVEKVNGYKKVTIRLRGGMFFYEEFGEIGGEDHLFVIAFDGERFRAITSAKSPYIEEALSVPDVYRDTAIAPLIQTQLSWVSPPPADLEATALDRLASAEFWAASRIAPRDVDLGILDRGCFSPGRGPSMETAPASHLGADYVVVSSSYWDFGTPLGDAFAFPFFVALARDPAAGQANPTQLCTTSFTYEEIGSVRGSYVILTGASTRDVTPGSPGETLLWRVDPTSIRIYAPFDPSDFTIPDGYRGLRVEPASPHEPEPAEEINDPDTESVSISAANKPHGQ